MIKHISIVVLALLSYTVCVAQDMSTKYIDLVNRADSAVKKNDWTGAEKYYFEALHAEPANPMNVLLMSNVGLVRFYDGRYDEALEMLNDAAAIAPSSLTVASNRAKVLAACGRYDDALAEYSRAVDIDSMAVEPRAMRVMLNMHAGKLVVAKQDVDFLERHFSAEPLTLESASYFNIAIGNFDVAIPYLNKLIKLEPTAANYGQRAYCYLMTDNLNDSSSDINEAIRLDPLNPQLFLYRALLNKKRFRPKDATDDAKKAISLGMPIEKIKQLGL